MKRLSLAVLLALAGCGPAASAPDAGAVELCHNGFDDDGNGVIDCEDSACFADPQCQPPTPRSCGAQQDCGDIVNELVTKVCEQSACVAPGPATHMGKPVTANIAFDLVFGAQFAQTPAKTALIRFLYPKKVDGSPLTCAEALTLNGADQVTRSQLDENRTINQVFRALYVINLPAGQTTVTNILATVPQGSDYLLYTEAWSGGRYLNDPTGYRMAQDCLEGQQVSADGTHYIAKMPR